MPQILELALRLGAAAWDVFFLVPVGRGEQLAVEQITAGEYEIALKWLARVRARSPIPVQVTCAPQLARILVQSPDMLGQTARGCMAGRGFLFISHRGILQPCGFLDVSCGDLRGADFALSSLWEKSPQLQVLRRPENLRGACGACKYRLVCGGCRARAKAASGDLLGPEPKCAGQRGKAWLPPHEAAAQLSEGQQNRILYRLQSGLPLVSRPFGRIGRELGIPEETVLGCALNALLDGRARRIGGIFDPTRIGYASTLAAVAVPSSVAREVASYLSAVPGVTHCYLRRPYLRRTTVSRKLPEPVPNLWFTLQAPQDEFAAVWDDVCQRLHPHFPVSIPALQRYKIQAIFGADGSLPQGDARAPAVVVRPDAAPLTEQERFAVRVLQDSLSPVLKPYAAAAAEYGLSERSLLVFARKWRSNGVLRRVALVARHQLLGYRANAMVVWNVPTEQVQAAGAALSGRQDVTHCYERAVAPGVPGNLFAMLHAASWPELFRAVEAAEEDAGISGATVFASVCEYKKTSMRYFLPDAKA